MKKYIVFVILSLNSNAIFSSLVSSGDVQREDSAPCLITRDHVEPFFKFYDSTVNVEQKNTEVNASLEQSFSQAPVCFSIVSDYHIGSSRHHHAMILACVGSKMHYNWHRYPNGSVVSAGIEKVI